jgi:spore germination protein GerM
MKEKNFYKEYAISFNRKAALVFFCCCVIFMFLFTFSCTSADNSTSTLSDNNTITSDIDNDEVEEGSKINNNDETADIDDSPVAGENDVDEDQPVEDEEVIESSELTINVYYADAMGEYLVGEARVISSENKYVDALNELMKLPIDSSLFQLIPDTTKINSIVVKDGLAKVDLSKDFVEDKITSDTEDNLLVYSIVNTLTEFPEVNSVSFYIDGEKLNDLGMIAIEEPVFRRNDLIK